MIKIPDKTFFKGAAQNKLVLGGFASVYTLSNTKTWDEITQTTLFFASGNNGGVPSSMRYGVGVAIVRDDVGIQIYKPNSADTNIYFRQRWNGAWYTFVERYILLPC